VPLDAAGAQIAEELGGRIDPGYQQVVAGARARYVEEMPFGVVDLLEIGVVRDRLDALL